MGLSLGFYCEPGTVYPVRDHPHRFILTHSHRRVYEAEGTPTLLDIALGLSRQPRFGGQTRRLWTVIDHSLFVAELAAIYAVAQGWGPLTSRPFVLAGLLHDAHEGLTGDVPSPFKPRGLKEVQDNLDQQIMQAYFPGGYAVFQAFAPEIHMLDRRALLAEALVVGPRQLTTPERVRVFFGARPDPADVGHLKSAIHSQAMGTSGEDLARGPASPLVARFLTAYASNR